MHAIVELNGPEMVSTVGSEGTPDIDDVIVQDASAQVIGQLGGYSPQPSILPSLSNATDHIVVVQHLQQARDIARIVLQIGIQGDYLETAGFFESSVECSTLPGVLSEADKTHLRLLCRQIPQDLRRMIVTAVIHEDEFI